MVLIYFFVFKDTNINLIFLFGKRKETEMAGKIIKFRLNLFVSVLVFERLSQLRRFFLLLFASCRYYSSYKCMLCSSLKYL